MECAGDVFVEVAEGAGVVGDGELRGAVDHEKKMDGWC